MNSILGCIHYGRCAGCVFENHLASFPLVEEAKGFYSSKGVTAPVHFFGAHEWRTRAKLAVRGTVDFPEIGLFERNSHTVLPIPECRVQHPAINAAVARLISWIKSEQILPYNEETQNGVLRYIQCTVERSSGKIQLALVCTQKLPSKSVLKLWESSPFWHSIWVNLNVRKDNVIFGESWERLFGEEWLWERLAGVDCCFHPAGFAQANLTAYEAVLKRIGELVPSSKKVVEYYAGSGGIGLTLAAKGCEVDCFESNSACEPSFKESKHRLEAGVITWKCSTTANSIEKLNGYDVIVVDPPRKGLDVKTLEALASAKSGIELVYVSCGWESCRKNIDYLLDAGWKLSVGEIYIFFPGSDHIETLQLLKKL